MTCIFAMYAWGTWLLSTLSSVGHRVCHVAGWLVETMFDWKVKEPTGALSPTVGMDSGEWGHLRGLNTLSWTQVMNNLQLCNTHACS